ncbi:MAG: DUF447 domain-containing protein [Thermovirgaceae bacterium]
MIIETILSTRDEKGMPNFAPMGIEQTPSGCVTVRPFRTSRTWRNLCSDSFAVVNVVEPALPFVLSALGSLDLPTFPARKIPCMVLQAASRWMELELAGRKQDEHRGNCLFRVVHEEGLRFFQGHNRARCALVETAIAATRIHVFGKDPFWSEFSRACTLVEKTGGEEEKEALLILKNWAEGFCESL